MDDNDESKPTSSSSENEEEWKKYGKMSSQEKRSLYRCGDDYVELKDIPTWTQYFGEKTYYFHKKETSGKLCKRVFPFSSKLNSKVSLWQGDITAIEVDAIVNAANKSLLGGGGVDGCIHRAAGPTLVKECYLLNGCETGDAKITLGHKLPAKYVLHTVGPIGKQEDKLESCYKTCLNLCLEHDIKSVAFCCISTGIYGYPNRDAADVALRTTRNWLEENADHVDRIIFCLFLDKDIDIYHSLMFKYFPPTEEDDIKESEKKKQKTKSHGNEEELKENITKDDVLEQATKKQKPNEKEDDGALENPVSMEETMEETMDISEDQRESAIDATEHDSPTENKATIQKPDKDTKALHQDKDDVSANTVTTEQRGDKDSEQVPQSSI